jgi:hypothetical protein
VVVAVSALRRHRSALDEVDAHPDALSDSISSSWG